MATVTKERQDLEAYERLMILKAMNEQLTDNDFEHHQELWEAEENAREHRTRT